MAKQATGTLLKTVATNGVRPDNRNDALCADPIHELREVMAEHSVNGSWMMSRLAAERLWSRAVVDALWPDHDAGVATLDINGKRISVDVARNDTPKRIASKLVDAVNSSSVGLVASVRKEPG